ncbi:MAG: xanthine dehydrogenase [Alphaproteobacteria bacterium]|nr:xanthine dehydrogenase [Alphaproteobacteria bacterium]
MDKHTLDALLAARKTKRPVALVSDIASGAQAVVSADKIEGILVLDATAVAAARERLADDRSGRIEDANGRRLFVQVNNPPKRLIVVGAVHIAQPLVEMARIAGYAVAIVDPRGAFATRERFPGVTLSEDWPDDAVTALGLDTRTAVVTLTHDPKLDDPALATALRSDCFYIGALGSKRTHAARLERLRRQGFSDAELARIHGPVGLDLGATSPAEIAVSILAQIIQVLHRASEPAQRDAA